MIVLPLRNVERHTAGIAARRELQAIKAALASDSPEQSLSTALHQHQAWLQRLLGCYPEAVSQYCHWRAETIRCFGPMADAAYLLDAEECLIQIIRGGIRHAA